MHILHGTWLPEIKRFALWGEDTSNQAKRHKGKRGIRTPHPFALSQEHWLRYLDRFSTDSEPDGGKFLILLPGSGKEVQPSPEAQSAGLAALADDLQLLTWEIDAVTLTATDTLDLLLQMPTSQEPHAGFTMGSDLHFWQQATLLVMNCLVEQRYIPALEQQGSRYLAYWQPQPDPALVTQLAECMPPLCRAMVEQPSDAFAAQTLLEHFSRTAVDGFVRQNYQPKRRPVHPWLKALLQESSILSGLPKDNASLYEVWRHWSQSTGGAARDVFRVCFRLEEPVESDKIWPLRYMLQATDDPSLLVDAGTIWAATGRTLHFLERRFDQPQEKMLAALGLASRLFPPVERSLHESSPMGVLLTGDEAFTFLTEAAPVLEQNHFGVLVPNWWARRTATLKAKAKLKTKAEEPSGMLSMDTLVSYQWELSVGNEKINRKEFEQLVALKQPLVRFRGEWVALNPEQIESARKFFDKQTAEGEMNLLDALRFTANGTEAPDNLEIEGIEVEGAL